MMRTIKKSSQPQLILASSSPRRQELLKLITPDFRVVPAFVEEKSASEFPERIVIDIAQLKAEAVAQAESSGVILGADTTVVLDGQLLGKPQDEADAANVLRQLSGRAHSVLTGVWLINTFLGKTASDCVSTRIHFKRLDEETIQRYLKNADYLDKAGAYAIQDHAALFVDYLEGDYYNVMGLPVARVAELLKAVGYQGN